MFVIILGVLLLAYAVFLFVLFSSAEDPLLMPFTGEPTLVSIGIGALGTALVAFGMSLRKRVKRSLVTEVDK